MAVARIAGQDYDTNVSPPPAATREDDDGRVASLVGLRTDEDTVGYPTRHTSASLSSSRNKWRDVKPAESPPLNGQQDRSQSDAGPYAVQGRSAWDVHMGFSHKSDDRGGEGGGVFSLGSSGVTVEKNRKPKARWSRSLSPNGESEGGSEGRGSGDAGRRGSLGTTPKRRNSSKIRSLLGLHTSRKKDQQRCVKPNGCFIEWKKLVPLYAIELQRVNWLLFCFWLCGHASRAITASCQKCCRVIVSYVWLTCCSIFFHQAEHLGEPYRNLSPASSLACCVCAHGFCYGCSVGWNLLVRSCSTS